MTSFCLPKQSLTHVSLTVVSGLISVLFQIQYQEIINPTNYISGECCNFVL